MREDAVRDTVETDVPDRVAVVRWRVFCGALLEMFVWREMLDFMPGSVGVDVFLRLAVVVPVVTRRTAARAASVSSVAYAPPKPSSTRHTAKIALIPFILIWVSVANLRKTEQVKYIFLCN